MLVYDALETGASYNLECVAPHFGAVFAAEASLYCSRFKSAVSDWPLGITTALFVLYK
jgi:hypothetical protein